jgi:hypothetical protein
MAARPVFSRARRADCLREGSVIQRRTFLVGGGTMLLVLGTVAVSASGCVLIPYPVGGHGHPRHYGY